MFLQALDLSTALRPELQPDESLLFVQDGVGLYQGEYKVPNHQNGQVYLTTHRVCYVDNSEPRRNSTAILLKYVGQIEHYAGFLKSSPKVTLYPKASKAVSIPLRPQLSNSPASHSPTRNGTRSPLRDQTTPSSQITPFAHPTPKPASVTWVCPICSFSNALPSSFDPTTANEYSVLPPCQTCGIKPPLAHLLKAAIASATSRAVGPQAEPTYRSFQANPRQDQDIQTGQGSAENAKQTSNGMIQCSRCTFENDPSLLSCEICGASLLTTDTDRAAVRLDSPGPSVGNANPDGYKVEYIKVSFRSRGDKIFYEKLQNAMLQRKWLLEHAPPMSQSVSTSESSPRGSGTSTPQPKGVGIAGLEQLGRERQENNKTVISSAFEDLDNLMASGKELIALAESLAEKTGNSSTAQLLNDSAAGLGMTATKDMLDSAAGSDSLYLSELSRSLAEYLTDDSQAVLKHEGGVMSLVDFWAAFNRRRHGVELISPSDFEKAVRMWDKIGLPVRLREFRNGLLVVQQHDWTDDKTIAQFLNWFQDLREEAPKHGVEWDQREFGRGVTPQEAASRFGWSVGVATEELEMAEEKGVLCREEGIEGLKFWENFIIRDLS